MAEVPMSQLFHILVNVHLELISESHLLGNGMRLDAQISEQVLEEGTLKSDLEKEKDERPK